MLWRKMAQSHDQSKTPRCRLAAGIGQYGDSTMHKRSRLYSLLIIPALLTACATSPDPCNPCTNTSSATKVIAAPQTVRISAVGVGAPPNIEGLSAAQRRLMAMRTSKLDAYRSLAEQIQGVKLIGNSTVSMLAAQNDSFRAYVDATIRGARVISINPLPDGAYETVLEIELPADIYNQYLRMVDAAPQNKGTVSGYHPAGTYVSNTAEIRSADYYLAR